MSDLIVSSHTDGVLVVDSRLVAEELGIQHENFMDTLKKYQTEAEQAFGILRFQTGEIKGRGQPEKFAFLTEEQATFYATLSRNTPEVVQLKAKIVKAFFEARRLLQINEHILKLTEEKRTAPKQEELYQIFLAARDAMSPSRYLPS